MSEGNIITLLTDFGLQDGYVGMMKGSISQVVSNVNIIDLSHQIPPQNIAAGRFCLMNAYAYFPYGTIHIAVVDPGVGSHRRGVAIQFEGGYLVGPDNGVLSGVLSLSPAIIAVELTNPQYWRTPNPSATFHGRDIFAPVGGYLAKGIPIHKLGHLIDTASLIDLSLPSFQVTEGGIIGYIQYIDIFGNLVTNIPASVVKGKNGLVEVKERKIPQKMTYSEVELGELVALIGSHGWVEIAVNGGSAKAQLEVDLGENILIHNS